MNLTSLTKQVREAATRAAEHSRKVNLSTLWEMLLDTDVELALDRISTLHPAGWPGAVPVWEPLSLAQSSSCQPLPVIGVDGSQIYPLSDQPVHWAYVQAAYYLSQKWKWIEGQFIDIHAIERFKMIDEDGKSGNLKSYVDAVRTLLETEVARSAAEKHPETVILLDNPLMPFVGYYHPFFQQIATYADLIASMHGTILAGYTSSPQSHLLYNLIRLVNEDLDTAQKDWIVEDARLMRYGLSVGQRSAIFLHGSQRNVSLGQVGAIIYFFFLKVSDQEVARVEVPEWVARSVEALDRIQSSILYNCRFYEYPEALFMAHQRVAISLKIGIQLNQLALEVYTEQGGYVCTPAKSRVKKQHFS